MKSPTSEAKFVEGAFQIQSPILGVNFSNNMYLWNLLTTDFPLAWSDHYTQCKTLPSHPSPPKKKKKDLTKKVYPTMKIFMKKVLPYFVGGEDTLCFIFKSFPISISSSLTFVVQAMPFQAKLLSYCF